MVLDSLIYIIYKIIIPRKLFAFYYFPPNALKGSQIMQESQISTRLINLKYVRNKWWFNSDIVNVSLLVAEFVSSGLNGRVFPELISDRSAPARTNPLNLGQTCHKPPIHVYQPWTRNKEIHCLNRSFQTYASIYQKKSKTQKKH